MPKSKMTVDEFASVWYANEEIDADSIEDPMLRAMYVDYCAQENDLADLYEKIGDYIERTRSVLYEAGNAYVNQQSNGAESRLPN